MAREPRPHNDLADRLPGSLREAYLKDSAVRAVADFAASRGLSYEWMVERIAADAVTAKGVLKAELEKVIREGIPPVIVCGNPEHREQLLGTLRDE